MNYINRLFAATLIPMTIHIENDDATITHITWNSVETMDGDPPGFYMATSVNTCSREGYGFGSNMSEWKRATWKDVIKILRERFPRRHGSQCDYKIRHYTDIPPGRGHDYTVHCTVTGQHFHCACCESPEVHTGVYHKLCGSCTEKSDAKRRAITSAILAYESEFAVKFEEIREWRDEAEGRYDYDRCPDSRREDFHADG